MTCDQNLEIVDARDRRLGEARRPANEQAGKTLKRWTMKTTAARG